MKWGRMVLAGVLLAGLGIAVWWSNRQEKAKVGQPAADAPPKILSISADAVKQVQIVHRGEDPITVQFNASGKWEMTSPKPLPADPVAVAALTNTASRLDSERVVDPNVTDLKAYGLAPALIQVNFTTKDGKTSKLLIGENTPEGTAVYAKLNGDPRLFTMASSFKSTFDKEAKDLRDKRLLPFTQDKLSRIEITAQKQTYEFVRKGEGDWQIDKPKAIRADSIQTDDLVQRLKNADMDLSGVQDEKKIAAGFAAAAPLVVAKVTDQDGTKTLEIRKSKEDYYAKSSAVEDVYKVSKVLGDGLDKPVDAYRNKKIFDFGFNDPTRIEVTDGAKTSIFDKSGETWTSHGKKLDSTSVQAFIDRLRDLTATKFADSGFTTPVVTLTVVSNQGKLHEQVEIAPMASGGNFLARHGGDASFYELEANVVKELRQAVGDVREAQPEKKKVVGLGLVTDLYQLTMAAGYFEAGKAHDRATFELSVRRLPYNRNFILAAGLAQAVDYLLNFRITAEEIAYLRGIPQFKYASDAFFEMLAGLRFTGDVFAVPEGTPIFAGEPFMTVRAPVIEAQIPETYLLAMIGFQSSIATKAARVVKAALGRDVVEFGTRRAHSPEAGVLAGRAAYIGGCVGTSNAEAGFRYKAHVFGTAAHSWVMSFPTERAAFEQLQKLLGERTTYLIDTYDTIAGAKLAASLGRPLWGVRLDSGNLIELAPAVRKILDDAGLPNAKIMATGELNEYKIHELVAAQAPIDVFGVGTDLATSADAPSLGVIYKMVEMESAKQHRYTAKFSHEKHTLPGAKQIFRHSDHDVLGRSTECISCADETVEALQRPVILGGKLVEPLPTTAQVKRYAAERLGRLPAPCHSLFQVEDAWRVELSPALKELDETVRQEHAG